MAPTRAVEPLVVSVADVAVMLGITRQHAYQLLQRGVLRRVQLAGSTAVRVPVEDVYRAAGIEPPTSALTAGGDEG